VRFGIRIIPTNPPHWQALSFAACGIGWALLELGHDVHLVAAESSIDENDEYTIVFNAQHFTGELPEGKAIIYNAEQMPPVGTEVLPPGRAYLDRLAKHVVWDYSEMNRERLRAHGIASVLCPIGYCPDFPPLPATDGQEIDVLFAGSLPDRRAKILRECQSLGLKVAHAFGVYGPPLDDLIACSKVVLNVHCFEQPIWEIFRCSQLLANAKCVVSENGGADPGLEALARQTTAYVPYEKLAETCVQLCRDKKLRTEIAERGFRIFSQRSQTHYVREALAQS
jgi:hypothetical protein